MVGDSYEACHPASQLTPRAQLWKSRAYSARSERIDEHFANGSLVISLLDGRYRRYSPARLHYFGNRVDDLPLLREMDVVTFATAEKLPSAAAGTAAIRAPAPRRPEPGGADVLNDLLNNEKVFTVYSGDLVSRFTQAAGQ